MLNCVWSSWERSVKTNISCERLCKTGHQLEWMLYHIAVQVPPKKKKGHEEKEYKNDGYFEMTSNFLCKFWKVCGEMDDQPSRIWIVKYVENYSLENKNVESQPDCIKTGQWFSILSISHPSPAPPFLLSCAVF